MKSRRWIAVCAALVLLYPFAATAGAAQRTTTGNFVGEWTVSVGVDFTITSQSGGSCTGVSALQDDGYDLVDCGVSGDSYHFTITAGSDYESHNTGVIHGNSLTGEFHDTNGTDVDYTATRGGTIKGTVYDEQCSNTTCKRVGLAGIDLAVTGTDSNGDSVDQTETSGAGGDWSSQLSAGSYVVTPDPDGFDPEASDTINLAAGKTVDGIDFATCEGTPDAGVQPLDQAASANGCVGSYTITLGANVPQSQFVDPSGNGAGALKPDGSDYPAHNYTGPGHSVLYASFDGVSNYPGCPNQFNLTRREQLTKAGDPVEWRDYFVRSGNIGSAALRIGYNRHTREAVVLGLDAAAGTLTRVYDYTITANGTTRTGTCRDPETLVPYAIYKPNGNEFSLIVTWAFPFAANGGSKPSDVLPTPPAAVKKSVKALLNRTPGYSLLSPGQKSVVDASALKLVQIFQKNVGWAGAVQKLSNEVDGLVKFGAKELLEGPIAIVDGVASFISTATDGYPTMDAKIVGQFKNFTYYNTRGAKSVGTQLVLNAATDLFPNYTLQVTRHGTALPWTASSATVKVDNTVAGPTANYPTGLPDTYLNDSNSGATASADLLGGLKAKGVLQSDMQVVKNVWTWVGDFSTSFNASLKPGDAGTITWQFLDGHP